MTLRAGNYRADFFDEGKCWFIYDKTDSRVDRLYGCPNYVIAIAEDRESAQRIIDALAHMQVLALGK